MEGAPVRRTWPWPWPVGEVKIKRRLVDLSFLSTRLIAMSRSFWLQIGLLSWKWIKNQFYKNIRQLLTSFTCIIRQINISKLNSMSVTFFSCYKGFIWQLRILYMHATRSDRRAPKLHTVLAQYLRKTLYIQSSK